MALQTNRIPIHTKRTAKTDRVGIHTGSAPFDGGVAFKADGIGTVVVASSAGEDFTPGDAAMKVGIGRVVETGGMRVAREIGAQSRAQVGDAFAKVAIAAECLAVAGDALG